MLTLASKRFFASLNSFQKLQDLNSYLNRNRPSMSLIYFRANWNPECNQSDLHVEKFAAQHGSVTVVRVDTDVSPKIAKHYSVKAEPEFVFCLYGEQITRQIGLSYEKLLQKNEQMIRLSNHPDYAWITDKWEPYGLKYRAYFERSIIAERKNTST